MKRREISTLMKEHGFSLLRKGRHGPIWSDGVSTIQTGSQHQSVDPRAIRNVAAQIKRAVAKRNEANGLGESETKKELDVTTETREPRRTIIVKPKESEPPLTAKLGDFMPLVPKAEPEAQRPARVKRMLGYDPEVKDRIGLRIIELFEEGFTHREIALTLTRDGLRTSDGGEFSTNNVGQWCTKLGLSRNTARKAPAKPPSHPPVVNLAPAPVMQPQPIAAMSPPPPKPLETVKPPACNGRHVSDEMLAVLRDPGLTDAKKVKLLFLFMEDV